MAHVGRDRLCVHAGRDENRREGVAGLVQADWLEAHALPCDAGSPPYAWGLERRFPAGAEDHPLVATLTRLVRGEDVAEDAHDRDSSAAGASTRRLGLAAGGVPVRRSVS
jgi:hypothetical protein